MKLQFLIALTFITGFVYADPVSHGYPDDGLAPPPLADKKRPADDIVPTVRIVRENGKVIEKYSRAGQVYMVKVTPSVGPSYYYLDTDGDGQVDGRTEEIGGDVQPIYWRVAEWD